MFIVKQKHCFTDTCTCRSIGYQTLNNIKLPHTFSAPTRLKTADSSSKIPDAIIREPKAVDAGKYSYVEHFVRSAVTCGCNALEKHLFYLMVAYI
jgi:hypothetical protein